MDFLRIGGSWLYSALQPLSFIYQHFSFEEMNALISNYYFHSNNWIIKKLVYWAIWKPEFFTP